jgi:hypothetical protein
MPKKKLSRDNETLVGIITPIEWNDDLQITAVALCATDDEQYLIENGEKFFDLVQTCIEATGRVQRDRKTFRRITIKRFDIIESF